MVGRLRVFLHDVLEVVRGELVVVEDQDSAAPQPGVRDAVLGVPQQDVEVEGRVEAVVIDDFDPESSKNIPKTSEKG